MVTINIVPEGQRQSLESEGRSDATSAFDYGGTEEQQTKYIEMNRTSSGLTWGWKATQVIMSSLEFVVWGQNKNSLE